MDNKQFWDRVKSLMKTLGFTQDSLAELCGISVNTLIGWISKGRLPDAEYATLISKALNTTVEYLVTGEEPLIRDKSSELKAAIQAVLDSFN